MAAGAERVDAVRIEGQLRMPDTEPELGYDVALVHLRCAESARRAFFHIDEEDHMILASEIDPDAAPECMVCGGPITLKEEP